MKVLGEAKGSAKTVSGLGEGSLNKEGLMDNGVDTKLILLLETSGSASPLLGLSRGAEELLR